MRCPGYVLCTSHRPFKLFQGTGKTTFAKLYGQLLKNLGILSKGEVVEATSSDLKGAHIGESTSKTKAMVEKCRGNVLIIDEANTFKILCF
jgi:replication-associated recombination protein RarA